MDSQKEKMYGDYTQKAIDKLKEWLKSDPKRAEIATYFIFCNIDFYWWIFTRESFQHDEESDKEYEGIDEAWFYIVEFTKNFGVTFKPAYHEPKIYASESFNKWVEFWHKSTDMPNHMIEKLKEAIWNNGDLTPYLPPKSWNEE